MHKRLLRAERGFSTLEVVVAVMIMGMILAAVGPQFVGSFRATNKAKLVSQAKGVLQGQLDAMRNLPFRVAPSAGDHLDLLDTYYRNLAAPATAPACGSATAAAQPLAAWTGYVTAASPARCGYEPAGAFYRYVIPPGAGSVPVNFAIVVDTQFVSAATPSTIVAPAGTYDSQTAGRDRAPVQQVGVTATALYNDHGKWHPVTVYTQIAAQTPAVAQIKLAAGATAVEIGSAAAGGLESLTMTGGQMMLTGSLFNTSEAKASLTSMSAASSAAGLKTGSSLAVSAPYANVIDLHTGQGDLVSGCSSICWGSTVITPFIVSADNGLPRAGVEGFPGLINPVHTLLPDNITRDGFRFKTGTVTLPGLETNLVTLDATPPAGELLTDLAPTLVDGLYRCAPSLTAPTSHVTASGYLNSTGDAAGQPNPLSLDACGAAYTNVVRVLPTTTAPDGLVRITARSSARCKVTGSAHIPDTSADYRAEVEYWKWTPALLDLLGVVLVPGSGTYVSAGVITPSTTSDPLASVPLTTPVSDTHTLGDYLESWTGLTASGVQRAETTTAHGALASLTVPAVVSLQTKPVRGGSDPASAVSVSIGAASCYAEDNR